MQSSYIADRNPVLFFEDAPAADLLGLVGMGFKGEVLVVDRHDQIRGLAAPDLFISRPPQDLLNSKVSSLIGGDYLLLPSGAGPEEIRNSGGRTVVLVNQLNEIEEVVTPQANRLSEIMSAAKTGPEARLDHGSGLLVVGAGLEVAGFNLSSRRILGVAPGDGLAGKHLVKHFPPLAALMGLSGGHKLTLGEKQLFVRVLPWAAGGSVPGGVFILDDQSTMPWVFSELESLRQINQELEVILDSSYDEIFVVDADGTTLRVSASACRRLYGVEPLDLIGRNVKDLVKEGLFTPSIASLVKEKKERVTTIQDTKSGKKIIVTANPVFNEKGEVVKIVANSRDITELNYLRDKLEESKGQSKRFSCEVGDLKKRFQLLDGVVIYSREMKNIFEMVYKVADVDSTVLILGESGVGKDVAARTIHQFSRRSGGPFIKINCSAIPENLLEAELFGYESGAFTGAKKGGKPGLIELANGGTLFLDEIGELPGSLQVKLLNIIQDRQMVRLGGLQTVCVDLRIIAATNKNMEKAVSEGRFREDLFYRLNVVPIEMPPLRERAEEIAPLTFHFLQNFAAKYGIYKKITAKAMEALMNYNWPGNVRELENIIERLVVTTDSMEIDIEHLPKKIREGSTGQAGRLVLTGMMTLDEAVGEAERQLISRAYRELGNTMDVARVLGVHQTTILRKIKSLGMSIKEP